MDTQELTRHSKHPWFNVILKFQGPFFSKYNKTVFADPERRGIVKVALLDDGVDPTYHSNGMYLHHAGWPEEDSGELDQGQKSPYVSTNQHGSKMAWLIRNVCPFVAIHVAKLSVTSWEGVRHRTFSLDHAKKVTISHFSFVDLCPPPHTHSFLTKARQLTFSGCGMGYRSKGGHHLHELESPAGGQ